MTEQDRQRTIRLKLARLGSNALPLSRPLPTGWQKLDSALGTAGLPRSRVVEIFGASGIGKTTLTLQMAAALQKAGGSVAWMDADHTFDPRYATALGLTLDRLPVMRPETAEQAFQMIAHLVASHAVDLVVVDSTAALVPELEFETSLGTAGHSLYSRVLSSGLQKLNPVIARSDATVVFLNQARARIEPGGGVSETSAGGPALKLYAGVRIALEPVGPGRMRARVLKNKASEAFRLVDFRLVPGSGFVECP